MIRYILCVPAHLIKASFFALYEMTCDFQQELILSHIVLATLTESPVQEAVFTKKKKGEFEQAKVGAKVEPHTVSQMGVPQDTESGCDVLYLRLPPNLDTGLT